MASSMAWCAPAGTVAGCDPHQVWFRGHMGHTESCPPADPTLDAYSVTATAVSGAGTGGWAAETGHACLDGGKSSLSICSDCLQQLGS